MIGIFILLALTIGITFFLYKSWKDLLGMVPTGKRMAYFIMGLLLMSALCLLNIGIATMFKSIMWQTNSSFSYTQLLSISQYMLKSVLTEELLFRGIVFYLILKKLKTKTACLISAIAFGAYHWLSYGAISFSLVQQLYILLITGLAGYAWAYAFTQSKTIWLPLGLHLGWNISNALFHPAKGFDALLVIAHQEQLSPGAEAILSFGLGLLPNLLTLLLLRHLIGFLQRNRLLFSRQQDS
ncbi:CPBP family intramembrane glutamic endopeptidase [Pedobacter sp. KR3-3]|uniref:CPBP family intramembrane glutamic endopeptidase n=1 Tax=Pedobacter albus TaxID=3113905 RepID=A0ABU7I606_9SPHI|nr:CPBP family intramembrane glutamic endopeptidase [Pedobacter sp. KR3-3]MEE1944896.1 CPBP family intramembrane glutamic endopeptidase [Pedobacter sp. KR3-3]